MLRRIGSPVATFKILDPVWINPTGYERIVLRKNLFQNKPLHMLKSAFRKLNPNLILDSSCAYILFIPPSVGVVGLAEYVGTHTCLIFIEHDPEFVPEDVE